MNSKFRIQSSELKKGISFIFSLSFLVLFAACSDFGDRDNPLDPAADNYVVLEESSSSLKSSSSVYIYSAGKNSSSSKKGSSSSTKGSSSSAKNNVPETLSYGKLEDSRDGKTYKTIVIGSQTWMAENLNYKVKNSYCFDDDDSYCDKYGRLYTLTSAKDLCPKGWRLPTRDDFEDLIDYVGSVNNLKAEKGAGSYYDVTNNVYGFTAYAVGGRYDCGDEGIFYYSGGWCSEFWTSTKAEFGMTYALYICGNDSLSWHEDYGSNAFSVRCIEGEAASSSSTKGSSSSVKGSSSSEERASEESSSSYVIESSSSSVFSIEEYLNPNISYGEITDDRDGQVYKTVKIGERIWMAQNLNYETEKSYCYDDKEENCTKLGRLYTWATAMDSAGKYDDDGKGCGFGTTCTPRYYKGVRGVCPDGWHLPTRAEWETLFDAVGGLDMAGKILRSAKSKGTNDYGFSAVPSGRRSKKGVYDDDYAIWYWTSVEKDAYGIYPAHSYDDRIDGATLQKDYAIAVRCLQNYDAFGILTDDRDGQQYKTIKIGSQNWMAENLNYAYLQPTATDDSSSFCYDNQPDNCNKYGRLYLWSAAMDSASLFSNQGEGCGSMIPCDPPEQVRGVCPKDWHLPSEEEWRTLLDFIGGRGDGNDIKLLKSAEGWTAGGNGSNSYGFNALPTGFKGWSNCSDGDYQCLGELASFWSSTEGDYERALHLEMRQNREENKNDYWVDTSTELKEYAQSVRCIEDAK